MISDQRGIALAGVLVATALAAIIALAACVTTAQVIRVSAQNEELNIAIRNAQNAGYVMSRDLLMAIDVSDADDPSTDETEFIE